MSTTHPFASREEIAAEARTWLIRLDADEAPAAEEIEALRAWIARSPAHRQELQRISEFWEGANVLTELAIPLGNARSPRNVPQSPRPTPAPIGRRFALATLCLIVLGAMIGTWATNRPGSAPSQVWSTRVGEQLTVELADGSSMQLDTASRVEVKFDATVRAIELLQGAVFFQVTAEKQRPFEVLAGKGLVTAIGTAFLVNLTGDDIEVIVTEGRVNLAAVIQGPEDLLNANPTPQGPAAPENLATLESGQIASFSHEIHQISNLSEREIARQLSWREGYLVFSGEPLEEVVAEVSRYTDMKIEIVDPQLRSLRVGGRFKVGDLEEIFEVLETNFGISVDHLSTSHVALKSDQNS